MLDDCARAVLAIAQRKQVAAVPPRVPFFGAAARSTILSKFNAVVITCEVSAVLVAYIWCKREQRGVCSVLCERCSL